MGAADRPTRVRLVPDFRSSYTISAITFYELRKAMGTSKFMIRVPLFDLKSLGSFRRLQCRDFKSAGLVGQDIRHLTQLQKPVVIDPAFAGTTCSFCRSILRL